MIAARSVGVALLTALWLTDAATGAPVHAADALPAAAHPHEVLGFGAINSRGAYEAGVAYALLHHLKRQGGKLSGVAGASVGSLNAFLAALAWCQIQSKEAPATEPDESPLWKVWQGISWDALFPGDRTCAEYQAANPEIAVSCSGGSPFRPTDALFSSNALDLVIEKVLLTMASAQSKDSCEVPIGIHLVADTPTQVNLGSYRVSTSRRYLAVKLALGGKDKKGKDKEKGAEIFNIAPPDPSAASGEQAAGDRAGPAPDERPGFQQLLLPASVPVGKGDWPVDRRVFLRALAAALAEPPMILTPPTSYCGQDCASTGETGLFCPVGHAVCRDRFFEGGVFDRVPLAAARLLSKDVDQFVIVDPSRAKISTTPAAQADLRLRGWGLYKRLIENFISVGTDYEVQTIARYRKQPGSTSLDGKPVLEVQRHARIVGALTVGSAALFDERFRRHDYYAGIYDGLMGAVANAIAATTPLAAARRFVAEYRDDFISWGTSRPGRRDVLRSSVGLSYTVLSGLNRQFCQAGPQQPIDHLTDCPAIRANLKLIEAHPTARDVSIIWKALADAKLPDVQDLTDLLFDEGHLFAASLRQQNFEDGRPTAFVNTHKHWSTETERQVVGRLADIESAQGNTGTATLLGFYEYTSAISASRQQPEWQLGSATVPDRVRGTGLLAAVQKLVLPYTAAVDVSHGGGRLLWEPLAYRFARGEPAARQLSAATNYRFPGLATPKGFFASPRIPVGAIWHWFRYADAGQLKGAVFGPTLGFELGLDSALVSDVGVRGWWHPIGEDLSRENLGAEFYLRPFWGRFEATLGWRRLACVSLPCDRQLFATLGLADVNGLFYWIFRAAAGDGPLRSLVNGDRTATQP